MRYPKVVLLAALLVGCASTPPPEPVAPPPEPPPAPEPTPAAAEVLLPAEWSVVSPEMLADAVGRVEAAMAHAHAVTWTRDSFKIPSFAENVGQVGWSEQNVMFALNDEVVGTVPRDRPCGSNSLRAPWRSMPVGNSLLAHTLEVKPDWWQVGTGYVRVGATDLIGVATDTRDDKDCALWGVIVEGPARVDAEVKSPGSSGLTDGTAVNVFGEEMNLVVAPTGVTLGEPPVVQVAPTFPATCAYVQWAGDLLGTRTMRIWFSNGKQTLRCANAADVEEYVHAIGPDGELSRTSRERRQRLAKEREDYVVRNIGVGRLIWESTSIVTREDSGCRTEVESITSKWTLKYPRQPDSSATARRVRTDSSCGSRSRR